jgi:hypothetical protein
MDSLIPKMFKTRAARK